jgi:cytochrome c oxidase subunit 2
VLALIGALLVPTSAAFAQPPSPLAPASTEADIIARLFTIVFWVAVGVFVIVEGLLVYSVIRFRRRHPDDLPVQLHGSTPVEIAWTVAPALIVAVLMLLTLRAMQDLYAMPQGTVNVQVVGHQWWWEFRYPDLGITTANELHIPVGEQVRLTLESPDVVHSFWVPELGGKTDAIPGRPNHTTMQATVAGTYHGQCAEFCGAQHALMRIRVIASPQAEFQQWVQTQQAAPAAPAGDAATRGQQTFISSACIGCHTIEGTAAQGKIGPDLTHFASRRLFAGASFEITPENLTTWVDHPQTLKPEAQMPDTGLSPEQISDVVAYLLTLK